LTPEEIRRRFAHAVAGQRASDAGTIASMRGDHSLVPGGAPPATALTPAAVLVPLVMRPEGLAVLLTQRTPHLAAHAGQISFPGGSIEADDADAVAAALRETEEEVGLPRDHVEVVGRLDTYVTSTGFEVTPIVGLVRAPYPVQLDAFEVAEVFEVPLAFIVDPANHQRQSREYKGRMRTFFVLPYENRYIWGATAGMLVNLAEVLTN
jgi:8-oxo-dGTP pyrophosphatase MutT (NUDIX family)